MRKIFESVYEVTTAFNLAFIVVVYGTVLFCDLICCMVFKTPPFILVNNVLYGVPLIVVPIWFKKVRKNYIKKQVKKPIKQIF